MATMNVAALWHDLECGGYREDLPAWRALAAAMGGPVLDIGAGTGRVTLDLAAQGVDVVALDRDAALLAALEHRAGALALETIHADARHFESARRFSLILVPMQTLQLLDGRPGREAFLRCASAHLHPGGIVAAALADAMDCFDDEHSVPPPPDVRNVAEVRYSSQLFSVVEEGGRAALCRRREITDSTRHRHAEDVVVHLDRVTVEQVAAEASQLGFVVEDPRRVPETEQYLGSTIVILRKPHP